jgi:hypothetical protein
MKKAIIKSKLFLRRIVALTIGGPIFVVGIILIPLPGPGVLITIIGLYILSKGFPVMEKKLDNYKHIIVDIYKGLKAKEAAFLKKHDQE